MRPRGRRGGWRRRTPRSARPPRAARRARGRGRCAGGHTGRPRRRRACGRSGPAGRGGGGRHTGSSALTTVRAPRTSCSGWHERSGWRMVKRMRANRPCARRSRIAASARAYGAAGAAPSTMPSSRTRAASSCRLGVALATGPGWDDPDGAAYDAGHGRALDRRRVLREPRPRRLGGPAALERARARGDRRRDAHHEQPHGAEGGAGGPARAHAAVEVDVHSDSAYVQRAFTDGLAGALAAQRLAHLRQEAGGEPRPVGGAPGGRGPTTVRFERVQAATPGWS